jgi:steroid delta-isomerase-like uncharacterized protein
MSPDFNKAIAREFLQIWGNGSLDIIDRLADPSITVNYPIMQMVVKNSKLFKQVMVNFRAAFPDAQIQIDEVFAEGDKVVIRWTFTGTHKGRLLHFPVSNKKVTWTGITIYQIANGKVIREQGEENFLGFLQQIGVVPQGK